MLIQLFSSISVNSGFKNIHLHAFACRWIFCHHSPRFQRIIVKCSTWWLVLRIIRLSQTKYQRQDSQCPIVWSTICDQVVSGSNRESAFCEHSLFQTVAVLKNVMDGIIVIAWLLHHRADTWRFFTTLPLDKSNASVHPYCKHSQNNPVVSNGC